MADVEAAMLLTKADMSVDERLEAQSRLDEYADKLMEMEDAAAEEGWEGELEKVRVRPTAPRALLPAARPTVTDEVKLSDLGGTHLSLSDKLNQIRAQRSAEPYVERPTPRWASGATPEVVHRSSFSSSSTGSSSSNFSTLASIGSTVSANDLESIRHTEIPVGWRRDLNQLLWTGLAATLQIAGGFLLDRVLRGHSPVDLMGSARDHEDSIQRRILRELENESS